MLLVTSFIIFFLCNWLKFFGMLKLKGNRKIVHPKARGTFVTDICKCLSNTEAELYSSFFNMKKDVI